MSDQPEQNDGGVLRPFEPSQSEPLPPVQPSSVVVPSVTEEVAADPVPAKPAASEDAFWSADGDQAGDPFGLEAPAAEPADDAPAREAAPTLIDPLAPPATAGGADQITLPRTTLFAGAGVVGLIILALLFLWQSAGGDGDTAAEADATPTLGATESADTETAAEGTPDSGETAADPGIDVAGLEAEIEAQAATIASLEGELSTIAPPAVAGIDMRRIVVAADASFVSVGNEGVAVIGPFGGYAAIDPATNAVTATSQVASGATRVMRTNSAVWVTNYADNQIVRIDPITSTVVGTFEFPGPDGVAKLGPSLAVASFDAQAVAQVDPATGDILNQVDVGGQPTDVFVMPDEASMWVALFDTGEVVRIDAASFSVTDRVRVGDGPVGLSLDGDTLWVVNHQEGTVVAVDTTSASVDRTFPVGEGPTAAVVFEGDLWVTITDGGDLVQLEPDSGDVITRTPLGTSNRGGPSGVAIGNGSLWVAMQGERSVVRVTPSAG
ncbi:MAG: hypothetical protein AAF081_10000 [Actinomycetota bacterium]